MSCVHKFKTKKYNDIRIILNGSNVVSQKPVYISDNI